jgi:hypothetical protein
MNMAEWQPIETIPCDGTPVLVWLPKKLTASHVHAARKSKISNGYMFIVGSIFAFDLPEAEQPTHWMPQPSAPTSRETHD